MKKQVVVIGGLAVLAALMLTSDALAQQVNLTSAFNTASGQLRNYAKTGMQVAGFISTVISLGIAGWKFMNKEPQAVWNVVGVVVGGVLFMVAQGL